ncbi:unnamed protein product [Dicrocoelium dendriticum]|nr:unnamed protein product [Dicrocoelium dendriticum]
MSREDPCAAIPSVDLVTNSLNPLTQLRLLQALTDARSSDSLNEVTERWNELTSEVQQHLLHGEEEISGLLDRLVEVKRNIKDLHTSIAQLKTRRASLEGELDEITNGQDGSSEAAFTNELLSSNLTQMTEAVQQFERLFRFRLQRTKSDSLQLFFHGCSPTTPNIVCSCRLRYGKTGQFEPVVCNPPVPDFEKLINRLNLTMDLRSFVILLRRRFCRYFELAAAISEHVE